jgi:hypothetical protein
MDDSPCTLYGGVCGYTTTNNGCGVNSADDCYCVKGMLQAYVWNCWPTCIIEDAGADAADASTDAGADVAADVATDSHPDAADAGAE